MTDKQQIFMLSIPIILGIFTSTTFSPLIGLSILITASVALSLLFAL